MKLMSTVLVVKDIDKSRKFYEDLLGQEPNVDLGVNVSYDGFAIQSLESWTNFIYKDEDSVKLRKHNGAELYFEVSEFEDFIKKLESYDENIEILHPVKEFPSGQKVIRLYDPDNHIIEVGEDMRQIIKKHFYNGMSITEIAELLEINKDYIKHIIEQ